MVFIYAKCDKCNKEYNTGFKFLPEECADSITETIKIKKALQEEIIRIIDKEEEEKINEVTKMCNDIEESLEQYKKEEENEVICKCGNIIEYDTIKITIMINTYGREESNIMAECKRCRKAYFTNIIYKDADYKNLNTKEMKIKKSLQETINILNN
jgi:hypothetical protein